ncbi:hypothetical protein [Flavobacterium suaedae]|nr:hypothetical protein [Flavobacterium suaedae]
MKFRYYLLLLILLQACVKKQSDITIDSSKIDEILIINKVDCNPNGDFVKSKVVIDNPKEIKKIVKVLFDSKSISESVNMKVNNGFFEIDFNEGNKNHYYTINYTIYDGVIVRNDYNGERYKNDELEVLVYKLFR